MEIKGKYGTAVLYATVIDEGTKEQVLELMNQKFMKDVKVRIMADCHAGTGCVIGTTMNVVDCAVPSLVGVDIGCGMLTVELGQMDIDLIKLDRFIRKKIPAGMEIYDDPQEMDTDISKMRCYEHLGNKKRFPNSMGTLGGGNHFIELEVDDEGYKYLVIHTGSRNLGKQVCEYYTRIAKNKYNLKVSMAVRSLVARYKKLDKEDKIQEGIAKLRAKYAKVPESLIPLYGEYFLDYMHDMAICQEFATENREKIAKKILDYLDLDMNGVKYFHTVHNYINMDDNILRKGSIAAYEGQYVLIPINMRDGSILAKGKSNAEYNYSAPHGAGRILSRKKAKETVSLDEFKKSMEGIYSTSVQEDTIDESPFAYKSIDDILPNILPTIEVVKFLKPIYNFKATKKRGR